MATPADDGGVHTDTADERSQPGRTLTANDDRLTRLIGALPLSQALVLALAIYLAVGLAPPLILGGGTASLVGWNVTGAALGCITTWAWIFPWAEARLRRQLLENTSDLRLLSAREFELLVGELFRREGFDVQETGGHDAPAAT